MPKGKQSKHDRRQGHLEKMQGIERSVPEEEQRGYTVQYHSRTENPYTKHEIHSLLEKHSPGDLFKVDPKRLRTMHAGISEQFSDGRKISDTVKQMERRDPALTHLPPIKIAAVKIPRKPWERQDPPDHGAHQGGNKSTFPSSGRVFKYDK
jgi:hypothetical protein